MKTQIKDFKVYTAKDIKKCQNKNCFEEATKEIIVAGKPYYLCYNCSLKLMEFSLIKTIHAKTFQKTLLS